MPNAPQPQRGGTLTVLGVEAPAAVDPHRVAAPADAMLHAVTHRTPYTHRPDDTEAVADLAQGEPEVSEDGLTVTVKLRAEARFGPGGKTITAADVEHGLERAVADPVAGPPARRLLGDVVGLTPRLGPWRDVPGIEALGARTLELRLARPSAALAIAALATPAATPLPAELPREPGALAPAAVVYSGPYLPRERLPAEERGGEPSGRAEVGAGGRLAPAAPAGALTLVRNPEWDGDATPTPAYVERIVVGRGEGDAATSVLDGSRALWAGEELSSDVLHRAEGRSTPQLVQVGVPVTRFVALNASRPPFDDRLVRRAAVAAVDRLALWEAAGGRGEPASHWLPPGVPGHDRSGGREGLGVAHLAPVADLRLAAGLLRRAGFADGRYKGRPVRALAADLPADRAVARAAVGQLARVGFEIDLELAAPREVEARCQAAGTEISLCPGAALGSLAGDPGAILRAGFGGAPQRPAAQPWSHLDSPVVDLAIAQALAAGDRDRPRAWAAVNRAVAEAAAGAPWRWDERPLLRGRGVRGVVDERRGTWALGWTWLGPDAEQERER
ncbi:MAG TPA: ABC transporter substrate-binding protein [Solirubrobacteraceae bacterium]|nr:ABC transporter substrate-binding protein [Solirubrobacteraceae bacterium]